MTTPIIPGAEPISITDGPNGGVLLLHGYMGTVQTVRDWARSFARAGFAVEAPLLPGHGTSVEDMADTGWPDYFHCAETAYRKLAERYERVFVGGLCIGGTIAAWLAVHHPETISGIAVVNGFFKAPKHWNFDFVDELIKANRKFFPWWSGKSVEDPNAPAIITYELTPIAPLMSLKGPRAELCQCFGEVRCPVLAFTSKLSPEFQTDDSTQWYEEVSGPVEHVVLERSNHVATLDYDKEIIESRSIALALAVAKGERDPLRKDVVSS